MAAACSSDPFDALLQAIVSLLNFIPQSGGALVIDTTRVTHKDGALLQSETGNHARIKLKGQSTEVWFRHLPQLHTVDLQYPLVRGIVYVQLRTSHSGLIGDFEGFQELYKTLTTPCYSPKYTRLAAPDFRIKKLPVIREAEKDGSADSAAAVVDD